MEKRRREARWLRGVPAFGLLLALMVGLASAAQEAINWERAQELLRKSDQGQKLTAEEQDYLTRARVERQRLMTNTEPAKERTGLVPLTEMGEAKHKEEDGGLYGGGRNEPPAEHEKAALAEAAAVVPRNARGEPSPDGKIALVSIGMSNTSQEFSAFQELADADPAKSPQVVIVNGAQGGRDAPAWLREEQAAAAGQPSPWTVLDERLRAAGVTAAQVQVVWVKQALAGPASLGEFPVHARRLEEDMARILQIARKRFPNLRLAYVSSRIYAGYATTGLNPEPYAYETAFAVRWLIADQIKGDPKLNWSADRGEVTAPLMLWGPYLWADGLNARKAGGLVWKREDLGEDGTHPSESGRRKVAEMLVTFFKTEPSACAWFLKHDEAASQG